MISTYLSVAQLDLSETLVAEQLSNLEQYLAQSQLPEVRWQYQIPELGEGGACSLFGYLQDEPFKLNDYIADDATNTEKLARLQQIIDYVVQQTQVDWFGFRSLKILQKAVTMFKLLYLKKVV